MTEDRLFNTIVKELNLKLIQVRNTVELLDSGNTVPFISRYRKEHTGSLDEDQIRMIQERIQYLRGLESRKNTILNTIDEQGKLTPELKSSIEICMKLQELEDLYLPYKPKKRTRAIIAREKGLEPLAQIILTQEYNEGDPLLIAEKFINPDKEVNSSEDALNGACDIIAEIISENADIRKKIRAKTFSLGMLHTENKSSEVSREYEMYFNYSEPVRRIPAHRILAINRGEKEKTLKVEIQTDKDSMLKEIADIYLTNTRSIFTEILLKTFDDAYARLIEPAIHREVRSELTEKADVHAIGVFSVNLKNLLMQPPVSGKMIMGIDPGYRTGCKVAIIDKTSKYLEGSTIYPHPPQQQYFEAKTTVRNLIEKYGVEIIAIGNGTASRETEQMIAELISEMNNINEVCYIIVSEAGASVYSASKTAQEEFPELEASMRGNISIARRLLDPLAELVKIDPKSIGVGLYQHDVNQKQLALALHDVIESCVNQVGVDLNTASVSLLKNISGLTSRTAQNIVYYRDQNGAFNNRKELKQVDGIGEIAFQQAAGFLRINNGDNPLDATSIHPESYEATAKLLEKFAITDMNQEGRNLRKKIISEKISLQNLSDQIGCGVPTLEDILKDLEKPGRDPREEMPKPIFKRDVLKMEDLREGMVLKGTVRNVVDFGAFVDIGVKQDGLVHLSQLTNKFIKSPHEAVAVGDVVDVKVLSIDLERGRISLSMKIDK